MKRTPALFLFFLLSASCATHTDPATQPRGAAADGISETSVRSHMEFLASDAMNGRASGSRDEWIAANYVAAHLRRLGLEPLGDAGSYVQTIELERSEFGAPPVLTIGNRRFTHGKELALAGMPLPRISGPLVRQQKARRCRADPWSCSRSHSSRSQTTWRQPLSCWGSRTAAVRASRIIRDRLPRLATRTLGTSPPAPRPVCVALDAEPTPLSRNRRPALRFHSKGT